jgi:rhamnulokinase
VLRGPLADLPAFRDTQLIAPACHDTASAVAGIPAAGKNWGYISSGTWSLVGTLLDCPCNTFAAATEGFTNLAAPGDRILFHKSINGMWLLKQCMDTWGQVNRRWDLDVLCALAELAPPPSSLLDVDDPDLLRMGDMPARINAQLRRNGFEPIDESSSAAPGMASLIFHSLAARYAYVFNRIEELTGEPMNRIFVVGGGSKNAFLLRLTAAACGREVIAGAAESSTIGNFAVQLAVLDDRRDANPQEFRSAISHYAGLLAIAISRN